MLKFMLASREESQEKENQEKFENQKEKLG